MTAVSNQQTELTLSTNHIADAPQVLLLYITSLTGRRLIEDFSLLIYQVVELTFYLDGTIMFVI